MSRANEPIWIRFHKICVIAARAVINRRGLRAFLDAEELASDVRHSLMESKDWESIVSDLESEDPAKENAVSYVVLAAAFKLHYNVCRRKRPFPLIHDIPVTDDGERRLELKDLIEFLLKILPQDEAEFLLRYHHRGRKAAAAWEGISPKHAAVRFHRVVERVRYCAPEHDPWPGTGKKKNRVIKGRRDRQFRMREK